MRLGDLDALKVVYQKWMSELDENNPEYADERNAILSCICQLEDQPSIDPESLPIVKNLKAELEKVKEERDAAIKELPKRCSTCYYGEKLCDWCILDSPEEVWEWKGVQKHIRIDVKYGVAKGIGKTSCDAISDLLASVKKKMKEGYEPPNGDFSIVREGDLFVAFQSMRKKVKVYEDK